MLAQKIERAIQEINKVIDADFDKDVFKTLKNICHDFCIEYFSLAIFSGEKDITGSFFLYSTYSAKWTQHYLKKRYYLCDPIFHSLQKVALPFEWNMQSFKDLIPIQHKLMNEAYSFGIRSGITIPLMPQLTFHGFLTIFNQVALHPDLVYLLSFVANVCTYKIMEGKEEKILECLTKREKEVLLLKSQGLAVKSISHKLQISHSAVAFHLANIRKKLEVKTTEQAITKFLRYTNRFARFRMPSSPHCVYSNKTERVLYKDLKALSS